MWLDVSTHLVVAGHGWALGPDHLRRDTSLVRAQAMWRRRGYLGTGIPEIGETKHAEPAPTPDPAAPLHLPTAAPAPVIPASASIPQSAPRPTPADPLAPPESGSLAAMSTAGDGSAKRGRIVRTYLAITLAGAAGFNYAFMPWNSAAYSGFTGNGAITAWADDAWT
jgi:hypothetical protein